MALRPPKDPKAGVTNAQLEDSDNKRMHTEANQALRAFEQGVGGRQKLVETLQYAALTTEQSQIVGMIADPRNDNKSLGTICRSAKINFGQLLQLFKDAGFIRAQLAAFEKVWDGLPAVAGDVMMRSIPHDMECQGCLGTKEVTIKVMEPDSEGRKHPIDKTVPCGFCRGTGLIKVIPDLEHQKVALEIGGILKKGQGIQVGVQVNTGGALVTPDDMKDFRGASDKLLYPARDRGSSEIVDAEVVDE